MGDFDDDDYAIALMMMMTILIMTTLMMTYVSAVSAGKCDAVANLDAIRRGKGGALWSKI